MENKVYTFDVVAAEDGSEDQMLQFSEEFLAENTVELKKSQANWLKPRKGICG